MAPIRLSARDPSSRREQRSGASNRSDARRSAKRAKDNSGRDSSGGPLSRDRARGAWRHTRKRRKQYRARRSQALPISLATVSLPPAASAVTKARRGRVACVGERTQRGGDGGDAGIRQRVPGTPPPPCPPRSRAASYAVSPILEVTTATPNVATRSPHPPQPQVTTIVIPITAPQMAPEIVTVRAKYPAAATAPLAATASGKRCERVERGSGREILTDERSPPQHDARGRRNRKVVVETGSEWFQQRRRRWPQPRASRWRTSRRQAG